MSSSFSQSKSLFTIYSQASAVCIQIQSEGRGSCYRKLVNMHYRVASMLLRVVAEPPWQKAADSDCMSRPPCLLQLVGRNVGFLDACRTSSIVFSVRQFHTTGYHRDQNKNEINRNVEKWDKKAFRAKCQEDEEVTNNMENVVNG